MYVIGSPFIVILGLQKQHDVIVSFLMVAVVLLISYLYNSGTMQFFGMVVCDKFAFSKSNEIICIISSLLHPTSALYNIVLYDSTQCFYNLLTW
jgi:hypothetical protein